MTTLNLKLGSYTPTHVGPVSFQCFITFRYVFSLEE